MLTYGSCKCRSTPLVAIGVTCDPGFVVPLACVLALLFGGADQYIGSLSAHPLGADISGLSAPWLVLPFVVGALQRTSRRAAAMGIVTTMLAVTGPVFGWLGHRWRVRCARSGPAWL